MKARSFALVLGVALWSCSEPAPQQAPEPATNTALTAPAKFDPKANPTADLAAAVILARASHRRIILDVGGEWCSWCHILDNFIETHVDLQNDIARDFVWLKINFSDDNENQSFLTKYPRIPGYPHLYVLSENGDLLHSQDTAKLELGRSYDLEKMRTFFGTWAKKQEAQ
jgi:thiol:disulfide interchange protein